MASSDGGLPVVDGGAGAAELAGAASAAVDSFGITGVGRGAGIPAGAVATTGTGAAAGVAAGLGAGAGAAGTGCKGLLPLAAAAEIELASAVYIMSSAIPSRCRLRTTGRGART